MLPQFLAVLNSKKCVVIVSSNFNVDRTLSADAGKNKQTNGYCVLSTTQLSLSNHLSSNFMALLQLTQHLGTVRSVTVMLTSQVLFYIQIRCSFLFHLMDNSQQAFFSRKFTIVDTPNEYTNH